MQKWKLKMLLNGKKIDRPYCGQCKFALTNPNKEAPDTGIRLCSIKLIPVYKMGYTCKNFRLGDRHGKAKQKKT